MADTVGTSEAELRALLAQVSDLRATLDAIRAGGVDALVLGGPGDEQVYPLANADRPYRVIVEQMGTAAATISPRGIILYANQGLADLLGTDRSNILGRYATELLAGDQDQWTRMLDVTAGSTQRGEIALLRADSQKVPVLVSMTGMDLEGTLIRCLVAADLTDRRAAEDALARSERRYRMLAENSTDVIVQVDLDSTIMWVSESAQSVLGWDPVQVLGTATSGHVHPDDLPGLQAALTPTIEAGNQTEATFRVRCGDGTYLWVATAGQQVPAIGDSPTRVIRLRDVSAEHEAQVAIAEREAMLRATIDALLDPLVVLTAVHDASGRICDFTYAEANRAACDYNGIDRDVLVGSRMLQRYPGLRDDPSFALYVACATTGEPARLDGAALTSQVRGPGRRFDLSATAWDHGIVLTWRDVTDRVRDQEEVRMLAENASDLVGRADNDGLLTWFSQSIRAYGWEPADVIGHNAWEFLHPDDRHLLGYVYAATSRGETARVEWRIAEKGNPQSWHWFRVHLHPVTDETGATVARISGWQNIDAERAATDALAASEELFRTALESASAGIALLAPWGAVLRVNAALCQLLGRDAADLLGSLWRQWQEQATADEVRHELDLLADLRSGARDSYRLTKRYLRPDGYVVHADVSVGAVRKPDRSVRHLVAQMVDVTTEHDQQQQLAQERARLRATLDSELEPHVTVTAIRDSVGEVVDFTYSDANPAVLEYLGITAEQLIGARVSRFRRGAAAASFQGQLARCLDTATPLQVDGYLYPDLFGDGDRYFDMRGALIGDAVSLTWRDVTERHEAQAALADSEQRYRLLAENSGDVVVAAEDGVLTYVSPAVKVMLGWNPEDLIGTSVLELLHPDDVATMVSDQQQDGDIRPTRGSHQGTNAKRGRYLPLDLIGRSRLAV